MLINNRDVAVLTQASTPVHLATAVSLQAAESVKGQRSLQSWIVWTDNGVYLPVIPQRPRVWRDWRT